VFNELPIDVPGDRDPFSRRIDLDPLLRLRIEKHPDKEERHEEHFHGFPRPPKIVSS
jgi:hypothetical protein